MNIVVPYTRLGGGVLAALDATGWPYRTVEMGGDDSYWTLLSDLWAAGEDFAVVEHDITVRPDVFDQLDACVEPWCVFAHEYVCGTYWGLGCARFRAELMARHPDLIDGIGERGDVGHPPKHWCTLDRWIQEELPSVGVQMHRHLPVLSHPGRTPAHGCL